MVVSDGAGDCIQGTPLLIQVEMPALNMKANLSFGVRSSRKVEFYDGVVNLMRNIADDYEEDLLSMDVDGSVFRLEQFRKQALDGLEDWNSKLKQVDEYKAKVDKVHGQMNKMRDDYYKELFFLREQVYQKDKAAKSGTAFKPNYATHFDPTEFIADDEVAARVAEKASFMKQEFEDRLVEMDARLGAKVRTLTQQLMASKMIATRKDKLLQKVMRKSGYEGEEHVENELGEVNVSAEKIEASVGRKLEKAEHAASKEFLQRKVGPDADDKENDMRQQLYDFLERKFGSAKEVKSQLGMKKDLDEQLGVAEFQEVIDGFGYACDVKQVFKQLSGGQPYVTLRCISEPPRRPVPPPGLALSGFSDGALAKFTKGKPRRHSAGAASGHVSLGSIAESDEVTSIVPNASTVQDDSISFCGSSSESSESSHSQSSRASSSKRSSASKKSGGFSKVAQTVKRVSNVFKRAGKKGGRGKAVDQETMTEVTCDTGLTAAFAGQAGSVACFKTCSSMVECGTDATPFNEAYKKVKLVSRTCQSQVDNRMLDKAMDFYDKVAEDNWNALADIWNDDSSESGAEDQANRGRCSTRQSSASRGFAPKGKIDARICMTVESGLDYLMKQARLDKEGDSREQSSNRIQTTLDFGAIDFRKKVAQSSARVASPERGGLHAFHYISSKDDAIKRWFSSEGSDSIKAGMSTQPQAKGQPHASCFEDLERLPRACPRPGKSIGVQSGSSAIDVQEMGVQCAMMRIVMLSPFERWFPGEDDPHEIQLQQLLDMAHEIQDRLPELVRRAEKLAAVAKSETEHQLVQELRALQLAPSSPGGRLSFDCTPKSGTTQSPKTNTVSELLARHGISTAAALPAPSAPNPDEERHTFAGFSKASRNGRPPARRTPPVHALRNNQQDDYDARQSEPSMTRRISSTARPMKQVDNAKMVTERASFCSPRSSSGGRDRSATPDSATDLKLQPGWSGLIEKEECGFEQRGVPAEMSGATQASTAAGSAKPVQGQFKRLSTSNFSFEGETTADSNVSQRARSSLSNRMTTGSVTRSPPRGEHQRNAFTERTTFSERNTFGRPSSKDQKEKHRRFFSPGESSQGSEPHRRFFSPTDSGQGQEQHRQIFSPPDSSPSRQGNNNTEPSGRVLVVDDYDDCRATMDSMARDSMVRDSLVCAEDLQGFGDDFGADATHDPLLGELEPDSPPSPHVLGTFSAMSGKIGAALRSGERKNALHVGAAAVRALEEPPKEGPQPSSGSSWELPVLPPGSGKRNLKQTSTSQSSMGRASFTAASKSRTCGTFSPEALDDTGTASAKHAPRESFNGRSSFSNRTFSPDSLEEAGVSAHLVVHPKVSAHSGSKVSNVPVRPPAKAAGPQSLRKLRTLEVSSATNSGEASDQQAASGRGPQRSQSPAVAQGEQADPFESNRQTFEGPPSRHTFDVTSPVAKTQPRRGNGVSQVGSVMPRRLSGSNFTAPPSERRASGSTGSALPTFGTNGTVDKMMPAGSTMGGGSLVIAPQRGVIK